MEVFFSTFSVDFLFELDVTVVITEKNHGCNNMAQSVKWAWKENDKDF